ncbi:uncharacterized protein ARMOST_09052 [Armillaria ostoyae]|uniref:Hyaluronan/mRNA-binding protein domain-containing protein n=2 Tax=Armillaria TaxID=47424 RepID=A0A284RAB9_ARMOS|nr:hypothetical protein ARMSODRAFT_1012429 [Armillaria solidipes]SJL05716.1 uncharacterized protein ARMOST_09052 [Armillaria ostoyae]
MSVATKNPFALLDEEDARPTTPPPQPKQEAPAPARTNQKPRGGPASRGGKYYQRGGKSAPRDGNPTQDGAQDPVSPEGQRKFEGRGRGRGGRGGGRGGRGRPFDRQSQTGKTDSDKKVHQGWGGDDGPTELKQEEAAVTDAVVEGSGEWAAPNAASGGDWGAPAPGGDWGAPAPGGDAWETPATGDATADTAAPVDKPPRKEREEEEDNTLTLDQYLAQQKSKEGILPKPEARKANEGTEGDLFKGATLLAKPEEEESYFVGKAKPSAKARAKKEEKVYLEIDARFDRPAPRGGRGRGRGGEGRGGSRGRGGNRGAHNGTAPSAAPVVNVDDETAFPSLS